MINQRVLDAIHAYEAAAYAGSKKRFVRVPSPSSPRYEAFIRKFQQLVDLADRFHMTPQEYIKAQIDLLAGTMQVAKFDFPPVSWLISERAANRMEIRAVRDRIFFEGKAPSVIPSIEDLLADGIAKLTRRLRQVGQTEEITQSIAEEELAFLARTRVVSPAYVCAWVHGHGSSCPALVDVAQDYLSKLKPGEQGKLYWAYKKRLQEGCGPYARYV